jgi:hypothetical protein
MRKVLQISTICWKTPHLCLLVTKWAFRHSNLSELAQFCRSGFVGFLNGPASTPRIAMDSAQMAPRFVTALLTPS